MRQTSAWERETAAEGAREADRRDSLPRSRRRRDRRGGSRVVLIPTERPRSARGFLDGQLQCPGGRGWCVPVSLSTESLSLTPETQTGGQQWTCLRSRACEEPSSFSLRGDRGTVCGTKPLPRGEGTGRPCR